MKKKSKARCFKWPAALLLVLVLAGLTPAEAAVTANDGFDPGADNSVDTMAVQADGKIIVGGQFTTIAGASRNYIARLNVDGSLDTSFNGNTDLASDSAVEAIAVQTDGKILVGGWFTKIGGQTRNGLARLNSDGTLDTSFDPNAGLAAGAQVNAIAIQQDGNIVVGGYFTNGLYSTCHNIARLSGTDGSTDQFFAAGANSYVYSIALQDDGKILLGGNFTAVTFGVSPPTPYTRNYIARLNTDGTPDTGFNPGAGGAVSSLAVQVDGKILVGGAFTSVASTGRNRIARLNPDGTLDTGFNPNANSIVYSVVVQPDGKVLFGGSFTTVAGGATTRNRMARLNQDGTLDAGFDPNVSGTYVYCIAVQHDDKILAGGYFTTVSGTARNNIARLYQNGALDASLNAAPNGTVVAMALQRDGKILMGGDFTTVTINGTTTTRNRIARLNPDGSLDTGFNPSIDNTVRAITVQDDGKILIGGSFTSVTISGTITTKNHLVRLNADGSLDTGFVTDVNNDVYAIAQYVYSDWQVYNVERILIGGAFTSITVNGTTTTKQYVAQLNSTGSIDDTFNLSPAPNAKVRSIAANLHGIYIGGDFTTVGGYTRNYLARILWDTTTAVVDSVFDPSMSLNNYVTSIVPLEDGKILIGGAFTIMPAAKYLMRINNDSAGSRDNSFSTYLNDIVFTMALQADGKIVVGGSFTAEGSTLRNHVARFSSGGVLDTGFDPNLGWGSSAYSIALQADGKVLIGGFGGNFARVTNTDAAVQKLSLPDPYTIEWKRSGASPGLSRARFGVATDPSSNSWSEPCDIIQQLTGERWRGGYQLPLGQIFYVRAHGFSPSGDNNGSGSVQESMLQAYIVPYTLTVTKTGTGSGIVTLGTGTISWSGNTGTASYGQNTPVTLYAAASIGSTFAGWSGGGCSGTGTCTVTMDTDKSVTATFNVATYSVTPSAGTGGTTSPNTPQTVNYNGTKSFTVTPDTGYHVLDVLVDGSSVGAVTSYTFTNVTADHTIYAQFAINTYTVTPSAGANGGISPNTPQTVNYNGTTSFTVTPNAGYHIDAVTGCGGLLSGQTYTTGAIISNCTVTASFAHDAVNGSCGTANGQTFTTAPSTNLCLDGTATAVSGTGPWTWSCTGLYGGTTASCSANIQTYTVTPSAGANGSISPNTAQTVNYDSTTSFTITPDSGYAIESVTGCGGSMTNANTYTTGPITGTCTVTASFTNSPVNGSCGTANGQTFTTTPSMNLCSSGTPGTVSGTGPWTWSCTGANGGSTASCGANIQTYTVTPSAGSGGSISPNTAQTVNYNGTKAFTVTPNTGYSISSVTGCGGSLSGSTYTTGSIMANCTVTASFIPPSGDLTGDGTVDATDALKSLRIASGIDTAASADLARGDVAPLVNSMPQPDGKVDIGDVVVILRKAVGLLSW